MGVCLRDVIGGVLPRLFRQSAIIRFCLCRRLTSGAAVTGWGGPGRQFRLSGPSSVVLEEEEEEGGEVGGGGGCGLANFSRSQLS